MANPSYDVRFEASNRGTRISAQGRPRPGRSPRPTSAMLRSAVDGRDARIGRRIGGDQEDEGIMLPLHRDQIEAGYKPRLAAAMLALSIAAANASDDATVSAAAVNFVNQGPELVLRDCPAVPPARNCVHGRLLHMGKVETQPYQEGDTFTTQAVEYDGLTLGLRSGAVIYMEVTKATWPLPQGLRVGMSMREVEQALGTPTSIESQGETELATYSTEYNYVLFRADGPELRVREVIWQFYYD